MTLILVCAALAFALPATAAAQSGSPGAAGADDAVYGAPLGPDVLGAEPGGQGAPGGTDPAGAADTIPVAGVDPAEAGGGGGDGGGGVRSIPFTGLALAVLVVAGVGMFVAGGGLRLASRART